MPDIRSIERRGQHLVLRYTDGTGECAFYNGPGSWQVKRRQSNKPGGGSGTEGKNGTYITAEMIRAAIAAYGRSESGMVNTPEEIAAEMNTAVKTAGPGDFMSRESRACLVGECCQECDGWATYEEYSHGSGDGVYWGRGMIQVTWSDNYREYTGWMRQYDGECPDFIANPDALKQLKYAAWSGPYYFLVKKWNGQNLCWWCDNNPGTNWYNISSCINAGHPGYVGPSYDLRGRIIDAVLAVTQDVQSGGSADGAVKWMLEHQGQFYYSQDAWVRSHMLQSGGGDCSSTCITAYEEGCGYGRENFGGSADAIGYTGTIGQHGDVVCTNAAANEGLMQPGDLILISWGGGGWPWDHVEMYIGDGQVCGHGGNPYYGPTVGALGPGRVGTANEVRRYLT